MLLRESAVWRDRNTEEVREAERHADYAYRLAVDAPAAKELRLFGLSNWTVDRFAAQKRKLHDLRWAATRLRERPVVWSLLIVLAANAAVFGSLAADLGSGTIELGRAVTFASAAMSTSMIAFGGLSWALDGAAAPAGAVLRLQREIDRAGALTPGTATSRGMPAREIRFRDVTFTYPSGGERVLDGFDLTIPAGSSLAIVGVNGAGKTTLAKLLCRLYDPQSGAIEIDGVDLRSLDLDAWRSRVTAVFQDFIRFELPLRDNVAPAGAPDDVIKAALADAGATESREPRYRARARLRRRHRSLRRPVAAHRAGARPVRGQARRGPGAARRTDRAARRARRGGDLRTPARRPRATRRRS